MARIIIMLLAILMPEIARGQNASQAAVDSSLASIRAYVQISDSIATSDQIGIRYIDSIKAAGFEVIINLAPARRQMNGEEAYAVVEAGLNYVQIPVDFKNPSLRDLDFFFDVMDANRDRMVWVHCFANMRVSSFIFLYRVIRLGESRETAQESLDKVWTPNEDWRPFIDRALKVHGW